MSSWWTDPALQRDRQAFAATVRAKTPEMAASRFGAIETVTLGDNAPPLGQTAKKQAAIRRNAPFAPRPTSRT
jgi:hypothetical protein